MGFRRMKRAERPPRRAGLDAAGTNLRGAGRESALRAVRETCRRGTVNGDGDAASVAITGRERRSARTGRP